MAGFSLNSEVAAAKWTGSTGDPPVRRGDPPRGMQEEARLVLVPFYHVMNRGYQRGAIFRDDHDRALFLSTLGEACGKTGWEVHALCLMKNHFHLVLETPRENLVAGMKWFLGTYTGRFNRRHQVFGHLFSGRDKALIVDREGGIEASAVAGRGIGSTGQRGCWQSRTGGAIAPGDGDDRPVDCGALAETSLHSNQIPAMDGPGSDDS